MRRCLLSVPFIAGIVLAGAQSRDPSSSTGVLGAPGQESMGRPADRPVTRQRSSFTFVVNSTADTPDADPGDGVAEDESGRTTLRAAIEESNTRANLVMTSSTQILFSIVATVRDEQTTPNGAPVIRPGGPLPTITWMTTLDGSTQPGSGQVQLDGGAAGASTNGLTVSAKSCTIQGLLITGFGADGVLLQESAQRARETRAAGMSSDRLLSCELRENGAWGVRKTNGAALSVEACKVSANGKGSASEQADQGGLLIAAGPADISGTEVSANHGIGIQATADGTVTLSDVQVLDNAQTGLKSVETVTVKGPANEVSNNGGTGILSTTGGG